LTKRSKAEKGVVRAREKKRGEKEVPSRYLKNTRNKRRASGKRTVLPGKQSGNAPSQSHKGGGKRITNKCKKKKQPKGRRAP